MLIPLLLYAGVVLALLFAELREDMRAQYLFKPLAALGFILLALMCGALDTPYGHWILAGLLACALGDVLLLARKSEMLFTLGMAAFGLGHFLYVFAFLAVQADGMISVVWSVVPIAVSAGFLMWLLRHLPAKMKIAVAVYTTIICAMIIAALGVDGGRYLKLAPVAAIMFAMSDMFVARDRFVKPDPKNALAITPLYFGAQALFALSVQV